VIFADATIEEEVEPFAFRAIDPAMEITFTTHSMAPESVIALCEETGLRCPPSFMLAIRGYEWEFREGLTDRAGENLRRAYEFLSPLLHRGSVEALFAASGGNARADVQ
jgi:hypothetical protein